MARPTPPVEMRNTRCGYLPASSSRPFSAVKKFPRILQLSRTVRRWHLVWSFAKLNVGVYAENCVVRRRVCGFIPFRFRVGSPPPLVRTLLHAPAAAPSPCVAVEAGPTRALPVSSTYPAMAASNVPIFSLPSKFPTRRITAQNTMTTIAVNSKRNSGPRGEVRGRPASAFLSAAPTKARRSTPEFASCQ